MLSLPYFAAAFVAFFCAILSFTGHLSYRIFRKNGSFFATPQEKATFYFKAQSKTGTVLYLGICVCAILGGLYRIDALPWMRSALEVAGVVTLGYGILFTFIFGLLSARCKRIAEPPEH